MRAGLSSSIEQAFSNCPRSSAGHRIAAKQRTFTGFAQRTRAQVKKGFPAFRRTSRGHEQVRLTVFDQGALARAVNASPVAVRLGINVPAEKISIMVGSRTPLITLNEPAPTRHSSSFIYCVTQAQRFTCEVDCAGFRRSTHAAAELGHKRGKLSRRDAFLVTSHGRDDRDLLRSAAVGRCVDFYRISFTGAAYQGLPTEYVKAQLFTAAEPAFGYTTIDASDYHCKFISVDCVGAPVGIVRSPRVGTAASCRWVIETHWSDKVRHHLDE